MEGLGVNKAEIVKELSAKYGVSKQAVYKDFTTKNRWQPRIQELKQAWLTITNRHDQIYRKASFQYLNAQSEHAKIRALRLMRECNVDLFNIMQSTGKIQKMPDSYELEIVAPWLNKFISSEPNIPLTRDSESSTEAQLDSES